MTGARFKAAPTVSIIMPTFNRRSFLPRALAAIADQELQNWELIVVDDGSTDDSASEVSAFEARCVQSVRYHYQNNQGAYGARNTGVGLARGKFLAFYDTDDLWLPHHLSSSVAALEANPDVDWAYSACMLVRLGSEDVLEPTSFYVKGRPRPFMQLKHDDRSGWRVIDDPGAIRCQIDHGLFCGLQNSVIRASVFERLRFEARSRNEAEDQLFAIRTLSAGFRLAYVNDVHVRYYIHSSNSSAAGRPAGLEKTRKVFEPLIAGYERLETEVSLTPAEHRALRRRLADERFWALGYCGFWLTGEREQALRTFRRALRDWPWSVSRWKTYLLAVVRTRFHGLIGRDTSQIGAQS